MDPGVRLIELLAYNRKENKRWKRWFQIHPEALELPCDIANAGTVRKLLFHVFAVELFFANKALHLAPTDFETLPAKTVDELFAISEEADGKFQELLERGTPADWAEVLALGRSGRRASRRKMMMQAMLHGVHHRGQLATLLRQQGFQQDWTHDFIVSNAME